MIANTMIDRNIGRGADCVVGVTVVALTVGKMGEEFWNVVWRTVGFILLFAVRSVKTAVVETSGIRHPVILQDSFICEST